ncbi:tRNA-dependent cyclodipeptide synthase [Nonomuraea sp. 10N515B]|uniref:tRNA-dependent cyclodipeptide synthase n=1 Tax=Nonomuraea sp. 10N515B TaxID=3457422 RepID=UPI003FCD78A9
MQPISLSCERPLAERAHACLGISPFNGYFTTERITQLTAWALRTFSNVHLFVPDVPAAATLQALGYSPQRAATKARRQASYLSNKICRALASLGVPDPSGRILDWAALSQNTRYRELLNATYELFKSDDEFADVCVEATGWVLHGRLEPEQITARRLEIAVDYLLAELPLFLDTAAIVGQPGSVFCYHTSTGFLERLYARELPVKPADGQGFAVVAPTADQGRMQ